MLGFWASPTWHKQPWALAAVSQGWQAPSHAREEELNWVFYESLGVQANTSFLLICSGEESWGREHFLIKSTSVTVWYEMCWVSECTYYSQPLSEIKSSITLPLVQTHGSTKCVSAHRSLENLVHHLVECDWSWMTSTDVQSTSSKLGRTGLAQERQVLLDRNSAILPKKASLQCITIAIQLTSYWSSTLLVTYRSY